MRAEDVYIAIGALAESLGMLRGELEKRGFDKAETLDLCKEFLEITLTSGRLQKDEERGD